MSDRHSVAVGARIPHGAAERLFPVADLPCDVHRYRDAERLLEATPSEAVLGLRKTGLASAYFLHGHPLTVVDAVSLPDAVRSDVRDRTGLDLHDYELVCIGDPSETHQDRTLAAFVDD